MTGRVGITGMTGCVGITGLTGIAPDGGRTGRTKGVVGLVVGRVPMGGRSGFVTVGGATRTGG